MDHFSFQFLVKLLEEALAASELDWKPGKWAHGGLEYATKVTAPGAVVEYRLSLSEGLGKPYTVRIVRYCRPALEPREPMAIGTPSRAALELVSHYFCNWAPSSEIALTEVIAKLMVETQESSAALTALADKVSHV